MKKKVLVLFGGVSSEHDVSLVSASSVISNIPREKYDVLTMGITKSGDFYLYKGDTGRIPGGGWLEDESLLESAVISPMRSHHGIIHLGTGEIERVDAVFPVLHGKNGEDGTMQGLLELSGIPYVGCDYLSSAVCMDKAVTNTLADFNGIPQAKWVSFSQTGYSADPEGVLGRAADYLGYPIFVKPANAGSSVGISKAKNAQELVSACEKAFAHDKKIVLEESITGKELECAVMGNDDPLASTVGEIVPCNDFYDYDAKYIDDNSALHIPARISGEKIEEIRERAVMTYKALGCSGLSRVDFFMRESDGKILFNEINTIPGFTSISMFPKLFDAVGIPYGELIDRLFEYALERK
jgi:D-alanine-D-alanine ligase